MNINNNQFSNENIQPIELTPKSEKKEHDIKVEDVFIAKLSESTGSKTTTLNEKKINQRPPLPRELMNVIKKLPDEDKERIKNELTLKFQPAKGLNPNIDQATIQHELQMQTIPQNNEELHKHKGSYLVWRGLTAGQLTTMLQNGSAGNQKANPNTSRPGEQSIRDQVGEKASLPEFTTDPMVAERFGTNSYVAIFRIESRYISHGSKSESGIAANPDAPAELVSFKIGRQIR
jgi:Domain of unknown function (DUF4765)